jgi:polyphosphate kinase 2
MNDMPLDAVCAKSASGTALEAAGAIERSRFAKLIRELSLPVREEMLGQAFYDRTLFRLQCELVKLQDWVLNQKLKVVVLFEGRDAAGKGGMIKRITQRLNPRWYRVVALAAPGDRERTQWYFQRYVAHLPSGGEIVFFDRSWYNRAGVERVMGFCSEEEYREFLDSVPHFERMITRSGIVLIKYWFSISYEEQLRRLMDRAQHPLKQWKLSPIDVESLHRWDDYTKAKEIMLEKTHSPEAPWWIVDAVDKRRARLNCMHHLLMQVPYQELPQRSLVLPEGLDCQRHVRSNPTSALQVPEHY